MAKKRATKSRKPKANKDAAVLQLVVVHKDQLDKTYKSRDKKSFGFAPKCHPDAGTRVGMKNNATLEVFCAQCDKYLLEFAVVTESNFQPKRCNEHPQSPVFVSYDKNRLQITCKTCKKSLHQLSVSEF